MIDACGKDEFKSEYVILRNGSQNFDIRKYGMNVFNPTNNAPIGKVQIQTGSIFKDALQKLNDAAQNTCGYGTVFRYAFDAPYNGIIPANYPILILNNWRP